MPRKKSHRTSDFVLQTLNFNEGGYPSVTVSAYGTAIQHMAAPTTTMMTNQTSATVT